MSVCGRRSETGSCVCLSARRRPWSSAAGRAFLCLSVMGGLCETPPHAARQEAAKKRAFPQKQTMTLRLALFGLSQLVGAQSIAAPTASPSPFNARGNWSAPPQGNWSAPPAPPPLTAECLSASRKLNMASACGYQGAYTCSASACITNAAKASDAMMVDMATGFATCTGMFASFGSIYTAEILTTLFLPTFDACGLTTSLTAPAVTSCAGGRSKVDKLRSACGSSDGGLTCGASKCTEFAASVTDSVLKDVATGLATCTGMFAVYSYMYTLEVLIRQFLSTFDSCGFTTSLTRPALTSCNGAVQKISQLSSACGSSDDGLTACGANKCTRFAASVTDSALKEMGTGLATCTGIFSRYSAYDPAMVIIPRLDECGLETSASRPPLNTCTGVYILWSQGEHCGSAGARTCSAACSAFVSSVTAAAVQDLTTGFSACAGLPIFDRYVRSNRLGLGLGFRVRSKVG